MVSVDKQPSVGASKRRPGPPFFESFNLIAYALVLASLVWLVSLFVLRFSGALTFLLHLGILSVLTFLIYALDKWRSGRQKRRVSERNLILLSVIGGAAGALLAMGLLRHKTQQSVFMLLIPALVMVQGVLLALMQWG
jgi:uncharacterized membrane protein YsdA (DUF1294 family)